MSDCRELCNSINELAALLDRKINIMEVCGTHTASIYKYGIKSLLPANINLISGPGCPVCVTAQDDIDKLLVLAQDNNNIIVCYGDMLKVPGSNGSLMQAAAQNNNVAVITSTEEILDIAANNINKKIIFWAVGFETTTPMTAILIKKAKDAHLDNINIYCRHKTMPQVINSILSENNKIDALLCPGHVAVIAGSQIFDGLPVPAVISGFEAEEILSSVKILLIQLYDKECKCINNYPGFVNYNGNIAAQKLTLEVFEQCDATWRGMGIIKNSGLKIKDTFAEFDAESLITGIHFDNYDIKGCLCGEIIKGNAMPAQCAYFGQKCNPITPIGPCMVSNEGACAAFYKYGGELYD